MMGGINEHRGKPKKSMTGAGADIGAALGVTKGAATGQWWWLGVFVGAGAGLGSLGDRRNQG